MWYEIQKDGLGFDFIAQFEQTLQKILNNPFYAAAILEDARRTTFKRFLYEIIYRVDELNSEIRILAIIHQRRDPEWFRKKLKD